jgi:hypothetical protein
MEMVNKVREIVSQQLDVALGARAAKRMHALDTTSMKRARTKPRSLSWC